MCGSIACWIWLCAKLNSRVGLHGPPIREWVARGGNIAPDADQLLCQERDKQFPIKPSAGTAVVMLGHVPQLGEALQSLKYQLDLPTHTVRSQNVRRRTAGAGRKHDHVLGKFECSRPSDHLLLARSALQAPMSLLNRAVALSYCTQAARKRRTLTMQDTAPFAELSRFGQAAQSRKEGNTSTICGVRNEALRIDAHQHISTVLPNILNPSD